MIGEFKRVEELQVTDLKTHAVWEYVNDDALGETVVRPVKQIPVANLTRRPVGAQVRLSNGYTVWALISNADANNPRANEHLLTISLEQAGKWFHLARYHDIDHDTRGPEALARFLGLNVDLIFPIAYDLSRASVGPHYLHCRLSLFSRVKSRSSKRGLGAVVARGGGGNAEGESLNAKGLRSFCPKANARRPKPMSCEKDDSVRTASAWSVP